MILFQRVLVVDQANNIEQLIQQGLLNYPVEMSFCSTQKDALTAFHELHPDLLVSGLQYVDGNALELIKQLKGRHSLVPSIFISDPEYQDLHATVLKLGAFDVIQRPLSMSQLHRKMEHTLQVTKPLRPASRLQQFVQETPEQKEYRTLLDKARQLGVPVATLLESEMAAGTT